MLELLDIAQAPKKKKKELQHKLRNLNETLQKWERRYDILWVSVFVA